MENTTQDTRKDIEILKEQVKKLEEDLKKMEQTNQKLEKLVESIIARLK